MYKLFCQKPGPFFVCPNSCSFPYMCIVLGTYYFGQLMKNVPFQHYFLNWSIKVLRLMPRGMYASKRKLFFVIEYEWFLGLFLKWQFSKRQTKVEVIKIQNPDCFYLATNAPWGHVLRLKSFCWISKMEFFIIRRNKTIIILFFSSPFMAKPRSLLYYSALSWPLRVSSSK